MGSDVVTQGLPTQTVRGVSGRGLLVATVLATALVAIGLLRPGLGAAPAGTRIAMSDYAFSPAHLTWRVGQRVTLLLVNDSQAEPPKAHEIMFGRNVREETGPFGPRVGDGFTEPLLAGVALDIEGGGGLTMLMAPGSKVTGVDPRSLVAPGAIGGMMNMDQFMAVFSPRGSLTLSFVVPDKPGEWEFACFQQDGQHFANGMHGTVTILPASSAG